MNTCSTCKARYWEGERCPNEANHKGLKKGKGVEGAGTAPGEGGDQPPAGQG